MSAALRVVQIDGENTNGPMEKNFESAADYGFEEFWLLYPRKEARKDALKAWSQSVTPADTVLIFTALLGWRKVWAARESSRFTPLPASWLRGERWHDEIPVEFVPRHASHAPTKPQDETPRGEMPASVREAIARLKKC